MFRIKGIFNRFMSIKRKGGNKKDQTKVKRMAGNKMNLKNVFSE